MQRLRRLRPTPAAAALLALVLLWAQALGLLHRVQHAPLAVVAVAADGSDAGLYGHERKSETCKLYDQLALGDGALEAAQTAALAPTTPAAAGAATVAHDNADRHDYRARAPPLTTA